MQFPFTLIDLTHTLTQDVPTWDGSCGFNHKKRPAASPVPGEQPFYLNDLEMHSGIGTHIDAPAHCYKGGLTIELIPTSELVLPALVIDISRKISSDASLLTHNILTFEEQHGKIAPNTLVFISTGWDRFWGNAQAYRNAYSFPSISREAASLLLERDIAGIGIDTLSPDTGKNGFPVHQLMLGEGKIIIENATNLKALPEKGAFIGIFPLKIKDGTESPLRLIGFVP